MVSGGTQFHTVCVCVYVSCYTPSSPSVVAAPCKTLRGVLIRSLFSSAVGPDRDRE